MEVPLLFSGSVIDQWRRPVYNYFMGMQGSRLMDGTWTEGTAGLTCTRMCVLIRRLRFLCFAWMNWEESLLCRER